MITKDRMLADIARAMEMPSDEIGDDDNLFDLGLDSMRLMDLLQQWESAGLKVDFSRFYEIATLREWWQIAKDAGAQTA